MNEYANSFPGIERRRSQRIIKDVDLIVRGVTPNIKGFPEESFTIRVSIHGVLLMLETKVEIGQVLFLLNPITNNEIESRVIRVGPPHGGLSMVGVEFLQPSTEFWPVK